MVTAHLRSKQLPLLAFALQTVEWSRSWIKFGPVRLRVDRALRLEAYPVVWPATKRRDIYTALQSRKTVSAYL